MATKIDRGKAYEALGKHLQKVQSDKYSDESNPVDIQAWLVGPRAMECHGFSITKYLHRVLAQKGEKNADPLDCLKIADHALMMYAYLTANKEAE